MPPFARRRRAEAGASEESAGLSSAVGLGYYLAEVAVNLRELRRDTLAESPNGHDGDDGDQGQQQAVLHHARTTLVGDVELGLDPGLENVKVHVFLLFRRRGAQQLLAVGARMRL